MCWCEEVMKEQNKMTLKEREENRRKQCDPEEHKKFFREQDRIYNEWKATKPWYERIWL